MKVVLFCGGQGLRLRDYNETIPKPMVRIGPQPILWYLMKYYAYYGHTDFILCLGYRGDVIKEYFLNFNECLANDFVLSGGNHRVLREHSDVPDWNITFVDTGQTASVGERLRAVREFVEDEEIFLANYTDGLSDLPLDDYLEFFRRSGKTAAFISVRPQHTFHVVTTDDRSLVKSIRHVEESVRINGGFFAFRPGVFEYIREGEDLVSRPFERLIGRGELVAYRHDGFWECMDTFKDKVQFDVMFERGEMPWAVWKRRGG